MKIVTLKLREVEDDTEDKINEDIQRAIYHLYHTLHIKKVLNIVCLEIRTGL